MVRIEHLMKEDVYRVVVTSHSPILSLRVRIPARVVLYLWTIFYSLYCTLFFAVAALRSISRLKVYPSKVLRIRFYRLCASFIKFQSHNSEIVKIDTCLCGLSNAACI